MSTPLTAEIRPWLGRPALFVNGQPQYPLFYALTDTPGGRFSWEDVPAHNVRQFARLADVRLFQFDLAMEHLWLPDGTLSLEIARKQVQGVLAARPDAAVVFRLHVRPPRWWLAAHSEENTGFLDAEISPEYTSGHNRFMEDDLKPIPRASLASRRWLDELGEVVARFCREFSATPEGDALIGIQVAGGVFGEWHYWGFVDHEVDNSPAMTAHFRAWLQTQYADEATLRQAWNDPAASFATASIPGLAERARRGDGYFRSPALDRRVMDYYRCQHELVPDCIVHFARIVKENWPRPILTGAFYGYFFACFGRDQAGGHLEPHRLLDSPWLDFLCAPAAYYPEGFEMGEPYRSRGLLTTARLHGKLWLDEMDQAIPLKPYHHAEYAASLQESIAKVRRNVLFGWANGGGLWFYDFGPSGFSQGPAFERTTALGVNGWWDDPALLADLGKLHDLLRRRFEDGFRSEADVLLVFDTHSYYLTPSLPGEKDIISHAVNNWLPLGVFHSGAAHEVIHVADLPLANLDQYRVIIFCNTFTLTTEQRRFIRQKVCTGGREIFWCYAPGYHDGTQNRDDFVREVTGLDLHRVEMVGKADGKAEITVSAKLGYGLNFSLRDEPISPLYAVADPDAEALGHFTSGEVAIARKCFADHTVTFLALPSWDKTLYTRLLERTTAHRYLDVPGIVYAGSGLLAVHVKQGGAITVRLRDGQTVALSLPAGPATVVLDSQTGAALI
jgi:hypothetical protein